jgi:hypothetical protein
VVCGAGPGTGKNSLALDCFPGIPARQREFVFAELGLLGNEQGVDSEARLRVQMFVCAMAASGPIRGIGFRNRRAPAKSQPMASVSRGASQCLCPRS